MGEQGHAAVGIKPGYERPQARDVAWYLPCPIGVAVRPSLAGGRVVDPVRMPCQIRLDRLDTDNVGVGAKIEDVRSERMGDHNDGDVRLFAQIEPEAQGSMRGEVTNENVRQRAVVLFLVSGTCTLPALILPCLMICSLRIAQG
jgi:hypothetical protein